jgi:hypothetical protein
MPSGLTLGSDLALVKEGYGYSISFTDQGERVLADLDNEHIYNYLSLSLKAGYEFQWPSKVKPVVYAGFSPSWLVSAYGVGGTVSNDGTVTPKKTRLTNVFGQFALAGFVEAGVVIEMTDQYAMFSTISYRRHLLSVLELDDNYKFKGGGLTLGIRRSL